jgi:hypothetical protein
MARGVSFFRVCRGGIGSCMCSWFSSVGLVVRSGFGAVRLVRFRLFVAVLGLFISIRSQSLVRIRGSSSGWFGSGLRSSGSCGRCSSALSVGGASPLSLSLTPNFSWVHALLLFTYVFLTSFFWVLQHLELVSHRPIQPSGLFDVHSVSVWTSAARSELWAVRIRRGQSSILRGVNRTRNGQSATLPEGVWIVRDIQLRWP